MQIDISAYGVTNDDGYVGFAQQNNKKVNISNLSYKVGETDTKAVLTELNQTIPA